MSSAPWHFKGRSGTSLSTRVPWEMNGGQQTLNSRPPNTINNRACDQNDPLRVQRSGHSTAKYDVTFNTLSANDSSNLAMMRVPPWETPYRHHGDVVPSSDRSFDELKHILTTSTSTHKTLESSEITTSQTGSYQVRYQSDKTVHRPFPASDSSSSASWEHDPFQQQHQRQPPWLATTMTDLTANCQTDHAINDHSDHIAMDHQSAVNDSTKPLADVDPSALLEALAGMGVSAEELEQVKQELALPEVQNMLSQLLASTELPIQVQQEPPEPLTHQEEAFAYHRPFPYHQDPFINPHQDSFTHPQNSRPIPSLQPVVHPPVLAARRPPSTNSPYPVVQRFRNPQHNNEIFDDSRWREPSWTSDSNMDNVVTAPTADKVRDEEEEGEILDEESDSRPSDVRMYEKQPTTELAQSVSDLPSDEFSRPFKRRSPAQPEIKEGMSDSRPSVPPTVIIGPDLSQCQSAQQLDSTRSETRHSALIEPHQPTPSIVPVSSDDAAVIHGTVDERENVSCPPSVSPFVFAARAEVIRCSKFMKRSMGVSHLEEISNSLRDPFSVDESYSTTTTELIKIINIRPGLVNLKLSRCTVLDRLALVPVVIQQLSPTAQGYLISDSTASAILCIETPRIPHADSDRKNGGSGKDGSSKKQVSPPLWKRGPDELKAGDVVDLIDIDTHWLNDKLVFPNIRTFSSACTFQNIS